MAERVLVLAALLLPPAVGIAACSVRGPVERVRRILVGCAVVLLLGSVLVGACTSGTLLIVPSLAGAAVAPGSVLRVGELSRPLLPFASALWLIAVAVTPRSRLDRRGLRRTALAVLVTLLTFLCESAPVIALLWLLSGAIFLAGLQAPEHRGARRTARVYVGLSGLLLLVGVVLPMVAPAGAGFLTETAAALVLAAALVRKGIFPCHAWVPAVFEQGRLGPSVLFCAPQVGTYVMAVLVLPSASAGALRVAMALSLLTAVYGAVLALVQDDARRACGYLFVSQSALVMAGFASATPEAIVGACILWLSSGLAFAGYCRLILVLEARRGRLRLSEFHGGHDRMPLLAAAFLVTGLACTGFPGTLGFVGEELLTHGALATSPVLGFAVILAGAVTGIVVLRMYFALFCGKRDPSVELPLRRGESLVFGLLILALIGGFAMSSRLVHSREHAAQEILGARGAQATR